MDSKEADRNKLRRRAKLGWLLIAVGFGIVGLVFLAAHGLGFAESSAAFSALVGVAFAGCITAVVGVVLILIFHLYDRSYPPARE